ncbi:hypothetical protein O181_109228 [Austropuccinia psidii MF-1]|uniref:Uncharacterized protein n=1 Tax=Austropuccinia psidii MF-1 TaxID=1389203 RepID=A0A9Q3JUC5_9BASI|nr:hypothetical protein [Austropuccinia psidii MF-1]
MIVWGSPTPGDFLNVLKRPAQVVAPGLQPQNPLVPASSTMGVNVYVDHGSRLAPPWIMPHIPPWNPSAHHQSAKNFRKNQAHVRWRATENISPAHTGRLPFEAVNIAR